MDIKKADFAGSWYPASSFECEQKIKSYMKTACFKGLTGKEYYAGISPHAGWYFSGSIACNVISLLDGEVEPDLIIIFGKHMHKQSTAGILANASCETPFGDLLTDDDFAEVLVNRLPLNKENVATFTPENTIELQLPFIKYFFGDVKIAIIGVPPSDSSIEIGKIVVNICKSMGLTAKIIGSTDMTHYGDNFSFTPVGTGQKAVEWVRDVNDKKMIDAMISMDGKKILHEAEINNNACCSGAVAATASAARALGIDSGEKVIYSSSYELSPGESFVGYSGIIY